MPTSLHLALQCGRLSCRPPFVSAAALNRRAEVAQAAAGRATAVQHSNALGARLTAETAAREAVEVRPGIGPTAPSQQLSEF